MKKIAQLLLLVVLPVHFGNAQWTQKSVINHDGSGGAIGKISMSDDGQVYAYANASYTKNPNQAGLEGIIQAYKKDDDGNWNQLGSDIYGNKDTNERLGTTISINSDGTVLAATTENSDVNIYEFLNGEWIKSGNIDEDYPVPNFASVAINNSGTIIAFGNPGFGSFNESPGIVKIYEKQNGNWVQLGEDLSGINENDMFGSDIELDTDGKTIAIRKTNILEVYRFDNNNWQLVNSPISSEGISNVSISDNGNIVAYCTPSETKVYENQNNNWLLLGDAIPFTNSGLISLGINSIDLSGKGDLIAVGEPNSEFSNSEPSGVIVLYRYENESWAIDEKIIGEINVGSFGAELELSRAGDAVATNNRAIKKSFVYENTSTLSMINNTFDQTIKYFPNPIVNQINIQLGTTQKNVSAILFDQNNKLLQKLDFKNQSQFIVPLNNRPKSLYFIKITGDNNKESVIKVVKK